MSDAPVSVRRVFRAVLDLAGLRSEEAHSNEDVVLGEAMKPFLEYGWQPQIMAVQGRQKAILSGKVEAYDVVDDPGETRNLGSGAPLPGPLRRALEEYPVPSPDGARAPDNMTDEARRQLASLGTNVIMV